MKISLEARKERFFGCSKAIQRPKLSKKVEKKSQLQVSFLQICNLVASH
jgi:hypothetical protein